MIAAIPLHTPAGTNAREAVELFAALVRGKPGP